MQISSSSEATDVFAFCLLTISVRAFSHFYAGLNLQDHFISLFIFKRPSPLRYYLYVTLHTQRMIICSEYTVHLMSLCTYVVNALFPTAPAS